MPKKKQKNEMKNLSNSIKKCQISKPLTNPAPSSVESAHNDHDVSPGNTTLDVKINPELLSKWPKLRLRIPPTFLHQPVDFGQHLNKLISLGIQLKNCSPTGNYTKINCSSFSDHKALVQYFEKKQLPYHTFGHPSKRKMKVVIRGLPTNTDLNKVKEELKYFSIPIIRLHEMHLKLERKDNTILVLAVVPYDEDGKRILKVNQILGHKVTLEPPVPKTKQCFRCQKWGHAQRYCHGKIKCVKCGGEHLYKKCDKNLEDEPPKCSNCNGEHTASYKKCPAHPDVSKDKLVLVSLIKEQSAGLISPQLKLK